MQSADTGNIRSPLALQILAQAGSDRSLFGVAADAMQDGEHAEDFQREIHTLRWLARQPGFAMPESRHVSILERGAPALVFIHKILRTDNPKREWTRAVRVKQNQSVCFHTLAGNLLVWTPGKKEYKKAMQAIGDMKNACLVLHGQTMVHFWTRNHAAWTNVSHCRLEPLACVLNGSARKPS